MKIEIAYTQHVGLERTVQQDALWNGKRCIQSKNHDIETEFHETPCLLAIADGVSSSSRSDLASKYIVENLPRHVTEHGFTAKAIKILHEKFCNQYAKGRTFGSSCTLVAVFLDQNRINVLNTGDSRAYYVKKGQKPILLSKDHTIINQMIDNGMAEKSTQYASIYNALTDCIIADHEEHNFSIYNNRISIESGDFMLMCSDGVSAELGDVEFVDLFDSNETAYKNIEIYRNKIFSFGAIDNFSLIIVKFI